MPRPPADPPTGVVHLERPAAARRAPPVPPPLRPGSVPVRPPRDVGRHRAMHTSLGDGRRCRHSNHADAMPEPSASPGCEPSTMLTTDLLPQTVPRESIRSRVSLPASRNLPRSTPTVPSGANRSAPSVTSLLSCSRSASKADVSWAQPAAATRSRRAHSKPDSRRPKSVSRPFHLGPGPSTDGTCCMNGVLDFLQFNQFAKL